MDNLTTKLLSIKQQAEQLHQNIDMMKAENQFLKKELKELRETIDLQKNTIKDLEEQNKITKIAEAVALSKTDKRAVKLKINEFIREIDKCIATLSD